MIRFYCPACRSGIEADEEDYGHKVNCPHCKASVPVPAREALPGNPIANRFWWYDWGLRLLALVGFCFMFYGLLIPLSMADGRFGIAGAILFVGALILMILNSIRAKMEER